MQKPWKPRALLVALGLAISLLPASASAAAQPSAASSKQMAKQIKALKQQATALAAKLSGLQAKASALEARGPASPSLSGPAAGDLVGSYPNPQIRAGAIRSSHLADNTIFGRHLAIGTLSGAHIVSNSIGSTDFAGRSIGQVDLAPSSVGGPQLVESFRETKLQSVSSTRAFEIKITCPVGTRVMGGGGELNIVGLGAQDVTDGLFFTKSVPSQDEPNTTWEVGGFVDAGKLGSLRFLFGNALCLRE